MKRGRTVLRLATRGSRLALAQAAEVAELLRAAWDGLEIEYVTVTTRGDRHKDVPLLDLQGPDGVFTRGVELELLEGRADIAVHSLKDVPTLTDPVLSLAAFPERADARDVLVARGGQTFEQLPAGAVVGTSSPRRAAQVLCQRPDLRVVSIRGNVDTRLRKLADGEVDALVLAAAGIERLGLLGRVTEFLPVERFTPAVGQGVLAVQCRSDDGVTRALVERIDHAPTRAAVLAERTFLRALGGGCRVPIAAYAFADGDELVLRAFVAAPDGSGAQFGERRGLIADPERTGRELAKEMLSAAGPAFLAGVHGG